jgi:hypothetical protein
MHNPQEATKVVTSAVIRRENSRNPAVGQLVVFSDKVAYEAYCAHVIGFGANVQFQGVMVEREDKTDSKSPFIERPWVRLKVTPKAA